MNATWRFFFLITLLALCVQGLFTLFEMACVSFNPVRLQYYQIKKMRRARWLSYLLSHPSQLFGTTLIGVNVALLIGSESSRRFYESFGADPDWAPLTQILIVMIFAELSPLFAGRRYSEHVALLFIPFFYLLSRCLLPVIAFLDIICRLVNRLTGSPLSASLYLSREDLQNLIEQRDGSQALLNKAIGNIFALKSLRAKEVMTPLAHVQMIHSYCTLSELRRLLSLNFVSYLPVYEHQTQNIVSIVYPRDVLRLPDESKVLKQGRSVWFITESASIVEILKQFRRNNQSVAVVLNEGGGATGVLTLDAIVEKIFGFAEGSEVLAGKSPARAVFIERSFSAEMRVFGINRKYGTTLPFLEEEETLGELLARLLGHMPVQGDALRLESFEIVVAEATLLGAKTVLIRSVT